MFDGLIRLGTACVVTLALSGCNAEQSNPARADASVTADSKVDSGAVQAISAAAQADLNGVASSIYGILAGMAQSAPVTANSLQLQQDGQAVALDWWFLKQGLIAAQGTTPYGEQQFALTPAGVALVNQAPPWFTVSLKAPAAGSCALNGSVTQQRCDLTLELSVAKTASGRAALPNITIPEIPLNATAVGGGATWQASDLSGDASPHALLLNALLGPADQRETARTDALQKASAALEASTPQENSQSSSY